jgi:hypothetical protein
VKPSSRRQKIKKTFVFVKTIICDFCLGPNSTTFTPLHSMVEVTFYIQPRYLVYNKIQLKNFKLALKIVILKGFRFFSKINEIITNLILIVIFKKYTMETKIEVWLNHY